MKKEREIQEYRWISEKGNFIHNHTYQVQNLNKDIANKSLDHAPDKTLALIVIVIMYSKPISILHDKTVLRVYLDGLVTRSCFIGLRDIRQSLFSLPKRLMGSIFADASYIPMQKKLEDNGVFAPNACYVHTLCLFVRVSG